MAYKNTLKGSIKKVLFEKNKKNRKYQLSYEIEINENKKTTNNPIEMSFEDFYKYAEDYYVDNYYIYRGDIENDLVVFKTYREDMEISIAKDSFLLNCISVLIAIFAIIAVMNTNKNSIIIGKLEKSGFFKACLREIETNNGFFIVAGFFTLATILLIGFLLLTRNAKYYYPNRIKSVNNVIFTLEAISENVVKVPDPKECNLEVSIAEKGTPPRVYSVNVNEILEDEIDEGTTKDKNKSIEIKINL